MAPVGEGGLCLRGQPHGDLRAEQRGCGEELGRRRHRGADSQLDALQREPPALTVLRHPEDRIEGDRLRQGDHQAHAIHLESNPKNVVHLTAKQQQQLNAL